VYVPAQRARSDARAQRVLVRVTTSQPGLMLLRVRDGHRRLLAQTVAPIYTSGTAAIHIPLTDTGRTVLRRAHGIRVLVGTALRSVTTAVDGRQTVARLR
jgi:hypothetical protein